MIASYSLSHRVPAAPGVTNVKDEMFGGVDNGWASNCKLQADQHVETARLRCAAAR